MKYQLFRLALAAPLLLFCVLPEASIAQAAMAGSVVAWGDNDFSGNTDGNKDVPIAAQSGVTAIAAGVSHTMALTTNGSVVEWEHYCCGQTNVPVAAQSGVTAIAAGGFHSVALKNDGSVVVWGKLSDGRNYVDATVPVGLSGVMAIAAGLSHTVALKTNGSVVEWGYNNYGQTNVPAVAQSGVTAIAAGYYHTVALKTDGSVVAWGNNIGGQTNVPVAAQSGVSAIAAGSYHSVALRNDGTVVAWGWNSSGAVTGTPSNPPYPAIASPVMLEGQVMSGVTAIAAGSSHTAALLTDGSVVAWGYNAYGQVTGTPTDYSATASPVTLGGQVLSGVMTIAAGEHHTVALVIPTAPNITTQPVSQAVNVWQSTSLTVAATGYYLNYQWRKGGVDLDGATNATYSVPFAHTNHAGNYTVVVSNSVGSVTSAPPAVLTVSADPGTVVPWGGNDSGETAVPVAAQREVTAIAVGGLCGMGSCYLHTVALKSDGTVVAWGDNHAGEVTGTPTDWPYFGTASPVTLGGQILSGVTAIAAGQGHTVALKNDGSVVAWGRNHDGQVTGTPTAGDPWSAIASPVTLGGQVLSGVTAIAAGADHTVALKNDGSVVAWGYNGEGQTTIPLAAQSGVAAIAAGHSHTVALRNDGSVVAWGWNDWGQTTVPVAAQSGVTAIAAGTYHTVALKNDGSVVAWGVNWAGLTDVPIAAQSGVTAIAAGSDHTVALKNDGTVVAWGNNGYGAVTGTPTTETNDGTIASPVTLSAQVLSGVTAIAAGGGRTVALVGGVPLLPSLKIRPHGNELILSWPTNAGGFTLQSTLDLTPPVTWLDSTSVPAVVGAHFTLTNTAAGGSRLYRLRKL